jgi:hypothetical protein
MKDTKDFPILLGERTSYGTQIKVWCPFCAVYHYHGWPEPNSFSSPDHRVAHCHIPTSPFLEHGYLLYDKARYDKATRPHKFGRQFLTSPRRPRRKVAA